MKVIKKSILIKEIKVTMALNMIEWQKPIHLAYYNYQLSQKPKRLKNNEFTHLINVSKKNYLIN